MPEPYRFSSEDAASSLAGDDGSAEQSDEDRAEQSDEDHEVEELAATVEAQQFKRRTRRMATWSLVVFVGVVIAAGLLVKVDYVALVPGSARDTEPLVMVEGVEAFPSDGEILYTTVRVRQEPNVFEYFLARFDDDAELVPAEEVLGDRTPDENREANLQLMTDSKAIAVAVALQELGYDAITSDGVVVVDVLEGTAAEGVLEVGDTIISVDGQAVPTAIDLIELLKTYRPASTLLFEVQRLDGTTDEISVVMGAREDDPDAAFLGISPQDRVVVTADLPVDVDIDSGTVGGPSAGLAFTLAILDQLTPGELTGDNVVAVTGTIAFNGRVGPVGGVLQKTAAVEEMGVEYFIVPSSLGEETLAAMEERAGDDLEIIPVESLDEALDALARLGGEVEAVEEYAAALVDS